MNAYRAKPLSFPWPPLVYGLAIVAALVVDSVGQLPLPRLESSFCWFCGAGLTAAAVWLDIWAMKTLLEGRTQIMSNAAVVPNRTSPYLVTRGPFRFSRNPTYLGYTLATIGFALLTGNPWLVVAALSAAATTDVIAIRHEELCLLARYGCEFESYCRHTRRWL
jgi:protein-S-isoprenylcysteine O-methyltransferase Ste14